MAWQSRRKFLGSLGVASALYTVRGAFAQQLVLTPAQTEGPFYPDRLPLDIDNDLLIINDAITPAVGEITWLSGRVLDSRGDPVRGPPAAPATKDFRNGRWALVSAALNSKSCLDGRTALSWRYYG